jgi:hypothetical protein
MTAPRPRPRARERRLRGVDAIHAREQIAHHGPGLTFGELAIGECFKWPPPIPRGPGEIWKASSDRYEFWIHGEVGGRKATGTAESFYRVERDQP